MLGRPVPLPELVSSDMFLVPALVSEEQIVHLRVSKNIRPHERKQWFMEKSDLPKVFSYPNDSEALSSLPQGFTASKQLHVVALKIDV